MNFKSIKNIFDLIKLSKFIETSNLGIDVSEDMAENLETIYEWEYKKYKIEQSLGINPKRKDNILSIIEVNLNKVLNKVGEDLLKVFDKWLETHALLSAETWARSRLIDSHDEEFSLNMVEDEYYRYLDEIGEKDQHDFKKEFFLDNLKYFKNIFEEEIEYTIQSLNEELDYFKETEDEESYKNTKENIEYLENLNLDNPQELEEYIDTYWYFDSENLDPIIKEHPDIQEMIKNFYEKRVFPLWFDYWEQQGIVETRETIEEIDYELKNLKNKSLKDKIVTINIALNTSHQTGSMLDYIEEEHYNVDKFLLDELSNKDTTEWDEDLAKMGVF